MQDAIKIIQPKPYQQIDAKKIIISGWVPKSWLDTEFGTDNRVFLDFTDINGKTFFGTSINVLSPNHWLSKFRKKLKFYGIFEIHHYSASFIIESQGRITLELNGHKKEQRLFIPVIIKSLNPKFVPDSKIVEKHKKIGEMIIQYEKDLKSYNEGLENIQKVRQQKSGINESEVQLDCFVQDWEISGGILDILEESNDLDESDYPFIAEDTKEKELEETYKDALNWQGPLCGGVVGRLNGFEFTVYSNDHGKHFHVLHKGRKVNARFSFPEIDLINYKNNKSSIGSKEKDSIITFFKNPENFKRLEEEFQRRS